MKAYTFINNTITVLKSLALGAASGLVVWCFFLVLHEGTHILWDKLSAVIGNPVWYPVLVCTLGALIIGLFRRRYGNYPKSMMEVIAIVKETGTYEYDKLGMIALSALLPLLFGASAGPEAGLVGVVVALGCWTRDKVNAWFKVTYVIAIASSITAYKLLNLVIGGGSLGFPRYEYMFPCKGDLLMMIPYIVIGSVLGFFFLYMSKLSAKLSVKLGPVKSEVTAGLVLGCISMIAPMVKFSGQDAMRYLINDYAANNSAAPMVLGISLIFMAFLKAIMTAFCIQLGLKGGHFFPLTFAAASLAFGISYMIFPLDAAAATFAAAITISAALSITLPKPIGITLLLFLCFPLKMGAWVFIASFIASKIKNTVEKNSRINSENFYFI